MMANSTLEKNSLGRLVPTFINNVKSEPFKGVGKYRPKGRKHGAPIATCADYPDDGNKLLPNLKEALMKAGLRDGVTISTHHHFRNGDIIANQIFDIAAELKIKNLVWAPSASFPCHKPIIKHLESGVIHHIEGSMNGDLGKFCSQGKMSGMGVLRSHGGRYQAIQDGELHIDIAVIAAPAADYFGNANGVYGDAACGSLNFSLADSEYADKVIVATDNLIPFPCVPWQIQGNNVDYTVLVDKIGIPEKIISGTTKITRSPDRLLLADMTAKFCEAANIIKDGFTYQAGAGGTALSIGLYFGEILKRRGFKSSFVRGGSNKYLVEMLDEGLVNYILDGQTFDLDGVSSMRDNPRHLATSPFTSYNYHGKGNIASMLDAVILGATEVDINFNGNVVTHSDGYLLHGIGGWQNCLFGKCVILPIPLMRGRVPVIKDSVTTICGPGEMIDVIVTERGIAINPLRQDLIAAVKNTSLPIKPIEQLKDEAERICGKPVSPKFGDQVVAAVKWVDGTVIDAVRNVIHE
ncbi:citrate lyase subunit alpha [Desulfocicer niacini]